MGIGIDLVFIPRIRGKETLAKRVLSPEEFELYQKRLDKDTFLAGRFAAKEAFFKAMHETMKTIPFRAISTINDESGAPLLTFEGKRYPVSISHDGDYAVAIVHIEE